VVGGSNPLAPTNSFNDLASFNISDYRITTVSLPFQHQLLILRGLQPKGRRVP